MARASKIQNRCRSKILGLLRVFQCAVFFVICFFALIGRAWAPTYSESRHKIFEKSFERVLCLAEFNDRIFVGVGHDTSAKIYRLCHDGCKIWEDVTPLWRVDTTGYHMAMAVFNNLLFVGTDKGEVFATLEGLKWYNVSGTLPSTISVSDMAVFNGYLYISSNDLSIWRSADGLAWEPVVGPAPPEGIDLQSIEVFDGYLYAGVGCDNRNGIQIWRTANGVNWTVFHEVVQPDPEPNPLLPLPGHVHAMTVFKNMLYIGEYEGSGLFRTDGSASSWEYVYDPTVVGFGVLRLAEHDGSLYLGNSDPRVNDFLNDKLLYQSADGSSWTAVDGSPTVSQDTNGIGALLSAGGKLYAGTRSAKSFTSDPTSAVQVYEMGWGPQLTCALSDVKKTIYTLQ